MTTSYEDTSEDRNTTTSEQQEPMKEQVEGIKQDTFQTGQKYADRGKNTAADIAADLADALQSAAGELDSKSRNTSAEFIRFASENIRKVSRSLHQKSVNQILHQAGSYGKRQPVLFLGGAMLAGYAITRLMKSANDDHEEDRWMDTMHPAEGRTTEQLGTRRTTQTTGPDSPAGSGTTPPSWKMRLPGQPSPGTFHSNRTEVREIFDSK